MISKVLIAERDCIVTSDLVSILKQWGYQVLPTAKSTDQALLCAKRSKPDLLIMDIGLRGKEDAIGTAAYIHKRYSIPVIILIDWMHDELQNHLNILGLFYYVSKPFDPEELHGMVDLALSQSSAFYQPVIASSSKKSVSHHLPIVPV